MSFAVERSKEFSGILHLTIRTRVGYGLVAFRHNGAAHLFGGVVGRLPNPLPVREVQAFATQWARANGLEKYTIPHYAEEIDTDAEPVEREW
ncbi:MAG TPA: hypothetical protein VHM70_12820, partial [Polyangiaceae bacterium]|jgi:hypothetical protein|nr:hypothetical protein [Polyangiaceae bacterium]